MDAKFQTHAKLFVQLLVVVLPPRNSRQSFRGRSVQDSSWSRTIFCSCFRSPGRLSTEDPLGPWHLSGTSSPQQSMMKTRRTYNLMNLRSFFCLTQVEGRNGARAACHHSHFLRFLFHLLSSPAAQRNPRSFAHRPPSSFITSSFSGSVTSISLDITTYNSRGKPMNSDCLAKVMPLSVCLPTCNLNTMNRCALLEEGRRLQPMRFRPILNNQSSCILQTHGHDTSCGAVNRKKPLQRLHGGWLGTVKP